MNKLFIFTAGNKPARIHLKDSIESSIATRIIDTHLTSTQKEQMQAKDGNFYAWGAIPGPRNEVMWSNLNSGDYILCVYANTYQYVSQCIHKYHNKELAEAIWGLDNKDDTWEYMYFLTEPTKISVPTNNVAKYLYKGYRGFTEITDFRLNNIRDDFTSIDNFINDQFINVTGNVPVESVNTSSSGDDSTTSTKEKIDESIKEEIAKLYEDAKSEGSLNDPRLSTSRKEQGLLRKYLIKDDEFYKCGICKTELPVDMIVAAHIKKRAECSIDDCLDYKNIVMPMCKMGCDDLYEKGYLYIEKGVIKKNSDKGNDLTPIMESYLRKFENKVCAYYSDRTKKYFDWHRSKFKKEIILFSEGNVVQHQQFGVGKVISIEGGQKQKLTIQFEDGEARKLIDNGENIKLLI